MRQPAAATKPKPAAAARQTAHYEDRDLQLEY
jgi:hypothetical protein